MAIQPKRSPLGRRGSPERRKVVRIEALGQLHGQFVSLKTPLSIRELSLGGFSMETTSQFPAGCVFQFRFSIDYGLSATLFAKSVHCRRASPSDRPALYVVGFEFLQSDEKTRQTVQELVNQVTSVVSTE